MIRTDFTQLVGVKHPILLAPMGGAVSHDLAVAVANAGAFAMFGASWHTPERLKQQIAGFRAATKAPFAINLALEWNQSERLAIALDNGAPVISLFWGDPTRYMKTIRAAGAKALVTVGSADEAKRAVDVGADAIVAQGVEAGGHVWSKVGTMVLVPAVIDAADGLPVIAAGGIADGRGIAAALALGASAAWIGTRFLATTESDTSDDYRQRLVKARETDTVYTELFDLDWPRAPHRVIRNSTYDGWIKAGSPPSGKRPGEGEPVVTQADGTVLKRYSDDTPKPGAKGDLEAACHYAGQSTGLVHDVIPAGDLVRRLMAETEAQLSHLRNLVD